MQRDGRSIRVPGRAFVWLAVTKVTGGFLLSYDGGVKRKQSADFKIIRQKSTDTVQQTERLNSHALPQPARLI